jgi:CubicO group peptidase (beta-lactamase class C family)
MSKCLSTLLLFLFLAVQKEEVLQSHQEDDFTLVEKYIQSLIDSAHVPGIAVAITRDDKIIYAKGFGVKNVDSKEKMEPTSTFHIASISKTFAATAVMLLSEKGKINIDNTLVTYLPYFKLDDERYKNITIRQMLNHTSGMPDVDDYEWEKAVADEGAAERYTKSLQNQKMISDPGKEFHYSNMAFDVFADLVQKVSGQTFEKYVKDNILNPLEMYESSFYYPEIKKSLRTSPHAGNPPKVMAVYPYNRMHAPSSTLNTNVEELSHWAIANNHGGIYKGKQVIAPHTYKAMTTPTFTINKENNRAIGLSWFIYPYKNEINLEHGGSDDGYRSILTLIPEKKLGIIVLCNLDRFNVNVVRDKIRDVVLVNIPSL